MPADVNVTEMVARWLFAALAPRGVWEAEPQPVRVGYEAEARHLLTTVLSDPEVLAGMARVLREHSESKGDASFLPSCRCGWVGSSRMAWVADLARHQAAALADWLRGQG